MSLGWGLDEKDVTQAKQALGGPQLKQRRPLVVYHPEGPACTAHSSAEPFPSVRWLFCGAV